MRKFLSVLFVCLLALPLAAQIRTGNIYGTVVDDEGNPLPGVSVTLTGHNVANTAAVTSAAGIFRFLSLFPASDYAVRAEIAGFKTKIETNIIVNVGRTADITVVMEVGALEEEITVIASTPVVSPKVTQITHTANLTMLQSLPSARDPWVILQMLPAVLVDRENVGGSESGQQASFVAKGESTDSWVMDGIQITDMSSISSPTYFDFDMFEEISVTTGMTDVENRERSIVVSFVSKRGGNKFSFGGRFYLTDSYFQGDPSGEDYESVKAVFSEENGYPANAGYNNIRDIKDFGFNMGGPLIKDKVWWWGSYGVQQIKTTVITGGNDDTFLNNMAGKLNFQLFPGNRAEIFIHAGDKKKYGRSSSSTNPPGRNQHGKYHWGSPIFKLQDEHMFGDNLFLSARYGFTDAGFGLWPATDENMSNPRWYDNTNDIYQDPWGNIRYSSYFFSGRPHQFGLLQAIYYLDDFLGTSHEMKFGAELNNNQRTWVGGYGGNFRFWHNYDSSQIDYDRDGSRDIPVDFRRFRLYREDLFYEDGTDRTAFYFQDIISAGRLNFNLQVRVDHEVDYEKAFSTRGLYEENIAQDWKDNYNTIATTWMDAQTFTAINALMPDVDIPGTETPSASTFWSVSPRVGLTFDVFGDGKTIAKAAFAIYPGSPVGVWAYTPSGGGGRVDFWWADQVAGNDPFGDPWGNGDNVMQLDELYWAEYTGSRMVYRAFSDAGAFLPDATQTSREKGLMWSGWTDWAAPGVLTDPWYTVDNDWKHHLDYDLLFSVEREIFADFGVAADFTYRWDSRRDWSLAYYPEAQFPGLNNHIRSKDDFQKATQVYEDFPLLDDVPGLGKVPDFIVPDSQAERDRWGDTISTQEAAGKDWYVLKDIPEAAYTDYEYISNRPDRHDKYWGLDLRWYKRFSNRWMLSGSFTYQMQRSYYGEGYTEATDLWAFDGMQYTNSMGGSSGKISVPMFTRWMFKLQGMYALPYGFNVSFSLNGREGMLIDRWFDI